MNAIRLYRHGGPEVLTYERVPRPQPRANEVLLETCATGVNFADVMRRKGGAYAVPTPMPYFLGGEVVGTVTQVGEGLDPAMVGKRVLGFPGQGSYADYVVVPANRVYPLPDALPDWAALALFVQGLTASLILKRHSRMAPGETVLVQAAAGGVGSIAVQLARIHGAGQVIGCVSTPAKAALVQSLGADATVNYAQPGWDDTVRQLTGGRGVDVVLEVTGGAVADASYELLAPFGRVVVFGLTGDDRWQIDTQRLCGRNATITGFWLRPHLDDHAGITREFLALADLYVSGQLSLTLGGRFALSDAAGAHTALEERATSGKLVLIPDERFP